MTPAAAAASPMLLTRAGKHHSVSRQCTRVYVCDVIAPEINSRTHGDLFSYNVAAPDDVRESAHACVCERARACVYKYVLG